jgi:TonB family protein
MTPVAAAMFVAQGTVMLGFGAVLLVFMRSSAAASRRLVCALALAGALLAPAVALIGPAWLTVAPMAPVFIVRAAALARLDARTGAAMWPAVAFVTWALIAGAMLLRMLAGWAAIRLELRRAVPVSDSSWLRQTGDVARRMGLVAAPDLRLADIASPVICGALRPVLLLPQSALEWSADRREIVLLHECAHAMRFDVWLNWLAQLVRCVFWFHPLAWYMAERLAREQELASDDEVLRAGVRGPDYADVLMDSVRGLRSPALFGCAMSGPPAARALRERVEHMLDERRNRVGNLRRHALMVAAFAAMLAITGALRPVWSQNGNVYKIGNGVTAPQLIQKVEPDYTDDARDRHIEGTAVLSVVISDAGEPTDVAVVRSLDSGLDANAVAAVKQWRFKPATKDGQPVAVSAHIEVNFRLY